MIRKKGKEKPMNQETRKVTEIDSITVDSKKDPALKLKRHVFKVEATGKIMHGWWVFLEGHQPYRMSRSATPTDIDIIQSNGWVMYGWRRHDLDDEVNLMTKEILAQLAAREQSSAT
jgi:hypothetical protein